MLIKFTKTYLFLVFITIILFFLIFIKKIIPVDYVYCSELISYSSPFDFVFPKSCDQDYYFIGFQDVKNIFNSDFNYQERPIYILIVFLVNKITSIFLNNRLFSVYLSVSLTQLIISTISVLLLDEILLKRKILKKTKIFQIGIFIILSPLFKWGIFDPSHQLITLIVSLLTIYFLEFGLIKFNFKKSFYFGFLFLLHREFVIAFLFLLLYKKYKIDKNFQFFDKYYINFLFAYLPTIIYQLFIRYFLDQNPYDANTEYWGQFIWIAYFLLGIKKYESNWHCVSIPENFYCYFSDNINLFYYLSVPLLLIIISLIFDFNKLKKNIIGIEISIFLFIFWSFIGWYPPIRFSYYSLGHLVIISTISIFFGLRNRFLKSVFLITYMLYSVYLNHWNVDKIILFNRGINLSIIFIAIFLVINIYYKNVKK